MDAVVMTIPTQKLMLV